MKLPENIGRGTCGDFNARRQSTGVIDESGRQHPNWAGYTYTRTHPRARWSGPAPERTQEGGEYRSCITVSTLEPNFSVPVTQDVMRWVPERPISAACSQANLNFHREVVDHEMEHDRRDRALADRANATWDRNAFSTRVCRTATTSEAADREARAEINRQVTAYLQGPTAELDRQIQADSDVFHQTHTVDFLDCAACQ